MFICRYITHNLLKSGFRPNRIIIISILTGGVFLFPRACVYNCLQISYIVSFRVVEMETYHSGFGLLGNKNLTLAD